MRLSHEEDKQEAEMTLSPPSLSRHLEEILQCDAPLMKEIVHMRNITTTTLLMLQGYVMKSLEEKW